MTARTFIKNERVAIISDVHNNEVNLKKVLDYCTQNNIQTIICCGDLASKETLDFLNNNFSGTIHYTFGNMDNDQLHDSICHSEPCLPAGRSVSESQKIDSKLMPEMTYQYKKTKIYKNFGETEIDGKKIAFVHFPNIAKKLCETGKYEFVFHGHTHKPWVEKINDCTILNPGNVAGEIYPPTFAIWDTGNNNFDLIRIHDLK